MAKPLADRVCALAVSVEFSSLAQLRRIPSTTRGIIVPSNSCNDQAGSWLSLKDFSKLAFLRVGDNSMWNVAELVISNVPTLKWVQIGTNSFTQVKGTWPRTKNTDRKFLLTGCAAVESLTIGPGSFADYGVCQIENVPALKTISIGSLSTSFESYNFFYAKIELYRSDGAGM